LLATPCEASGENVNLIVGCVAAPDFCDLAEVSESVNVRFTPKSGH
jgi:hypothetical protein